MSGFASSSPCSCPTTSSTALVEWQARELRRGRIVPPGNLHVTLAFLGSRPAAELPAVLAVLEEAAREAAPARLDVVRWRETRSVGMLELRDDDGGSIRLAERLHGRLAALGVYRPEARPWLPHLTVLRFRERPRLRPSLPGAGLGVVRRRCFPFPSAPVRGTVRGAGVVSARRS